MYLNAIILHKYLMKFYNLYNKTKTGCITRIHPVLELSQARGEVIVNVLLANTGTI